MENPITLLYPAFLSDNEVYREVEQFWRRQFDQLALPYQPFYTKTTATGRPLNDANPIFDAYFPALHKLVRVIQFIPESGDLLLTGWLDEAPVLKMPPEKRPVPDKPEDRKRPVPELVLSLALTLETAQQAITLLQKWILEDLEQTEMEKLLQEI